MWCVSHWKILYFIIIFKLSKLSKVICKRAKEGEMGLDWGGGGGGDKRLDFWWWVGGGGGAF